MSRRKKNWRIAFALQAGKYEDAKKILEELEKLLQKYNG